MNKRETIHLKPYIDDGVSAVAGRPRGERVRELLQLDKLDQRDDVEYDVEFPQFVVSVMSSFFLGLFDVSMLTLGVERFRAKYHFKDRAAQEALEQSIRRLKLQGTGLIP